MDTQKTFIFYYNAMRYNKNIIVYFTHTQFIIDFI